MRKSSHIDTVLYHLFNIFLVISFLKLYFIDYAITVVLNFPPLPHSTHHPLFPQATLHHCSCPWVMCISSLAAPFPVLCFTSPWLFVTTYLYFLISSPLHPVPASPLPSGNLPVSNCFSLAAFKSLFIFNLWPFNNYVSGVGLFASIIIRNLCAS